MTKAEDQARANVRMFAQLGLHVSEQEAIQLAKKVEAEVKAGRKPTFDTIKGFLAEMRAVPAAVQARKEMDLFKQGIRLNLPSRERLLPSLITRQKRDPVTLELIPDNPTNNPPCCACGETYDPTEMIRYPVIGQSLSICAYCVDGESYRNLIGNAEVILKRVTAAELKELRGKMVDAHPDKGGTSAEFAQANRRYRNAQKLLTE